ncbi:hypothetical protein QOZ95_003597 [Paenibacillus brasilensis]|uniref:Uncharacterized protein n=1 Tax=Paenibacillus brasilensis TaxID=128574 RepID=A0ABU0L161_9BACL|nr:hypothetical protein [Paenibacillus brasilensis]
MLQFDVQFDVQFNGPVYVHPDRCLVCRPPLSVIRFRL